MIIILWAIFNIVLAIMTVFGHEGSGIVLAWSVILGWVVAIITAVVRNN